MKTSTMWKSELAAMVAALTAVAIAGAAQPQEGKAPAPPQPAAAAGKTIVFLWQVDHHPNEATCLLLKHCLKNSPNVKGLRCEIHEVWPKDPNTLDDAAAIVVYCDREKETAKEHVIFTEDHSRHLDKLTAKGVGLVVGHYSLYGNPKGLDGAKIQEWVGAYYQWAVSQHAQYRSSMAFCPASPDHPICRGWKEFALPHNEAYWNLQFAEDDRTAPILTGAYPQGWIDRLKRDKRFGPKSTVTAWALERPSGGRGVGIGIGHYYDNWLNDDLRKMTLNAIVWAAGIEVPKEGVESTVPDELKKPKPLRKTPKPAPKPAPAPASAP